MRETQDSKTRIFNILVKEYGIDEALKIFNEFNRVLKELGHDNGI